MWHLSPTERRLRRGCDGSLPVALLFRAGLRLRRQARPSRADQAGIGALETPEGTADGPLRKDIPVVRAAERKVGRRQVAVRHRHETDALRSRTEGSGERPTSLQACQLRKPR
jgi:hypothetical protein